MSESTSEEFEAWFKARFWHECYEDVKHHLFAAWKASRESIVIELPDISAMIERAAAGNEYSAIRIEQQKKCRAAIEAAGLKARP